MALARAQSQSLAWRLPRAGIHSPRIPDQSLRMVHLRECWRAVRVRRNALVTMIYVLRCATHYHLHRLVLALSARDRPLVNTF